MLHVTKYSNYVTLIDLLYKNTDRGLTGIYMLYCSRLMSVHCCIFLIFLLDHCMSIKTIVGDVNKVQMLRYKISHLIII